MILDLYSEYTSIQFINLNRVIVDKLTVVETNQWCRTGELVSTRCASDAYYNIQEAQGPWRSA